MNGPEDKRTIETKRELSEAAKEFLANPGCQAAILQLRQRWFGLLLGEAAATPAQAELCARLRTLEALPHELQTLINDYRMAAEKRRA